MKWFLHAAVCAPRTHDARQPVQERPLVARASEGHVVGWLPSLAVPRHADPRRDAVRLESGVLAAPTPPGVMSARDPNKSRRLGTAMGGVRRSPDKAATAQSMGGNTRFRLQRSGGAGLLGRPDTKDGKGNSCSKGGFTGPTPKHANVDAGANSREDPRKVDTAPSWAESGSRFVGPVRNSMKTARSWPTTHTQRKSCAATRVDPSAVLFLTQTHKTRPPGRRRAP